MNSNTIKEKFKTHAAYSWTHDCKRWLQ